MTSSISDKLSLDFRHLPQFAHYILHNQLDSFTHKLVELYEDSNIPLLRFFRSMTTERRTFIVSGTSRAMLTLLSNNDVSRFIAQSISYWLNDQLPEVKREQIHALDITLVNYIRSRVFREFIPGYTNDGALRLQLVEELDRFVAVLNSELFSAYINLQDQAVRAMNSALERRELQLLEAQEIGLIGSFEWDLSGRKQSSFTPQMLKIYELDKFDDMLAFLDYVHPDERDRVSSSIESALVTGVYECEYRYIRNNKEKLIYSKGKVLFEDGKPSKLIGTITDVTERHRIIEQLRESEKLHKQAQAQTHIGNWSWVLGENKISWSDEMYRIYGLEPQSEEITYERFISFVHPEDRDNRITEIARALKTLKVEEYHVRITAADGTEKILRGKGEMIEGVSGHPAAMLGTCQDVTREFLLNAKLKEREQYLEQLNQSLEFANQELSRTNQELESFNFIASHDLQEPLRKIQVYSNRILENGVMNLPEPLKDYFDRINKASSRMQKLIEDFLTFSQTFGHQDWEKIDLNHLLEEIRSELVTRIEEKRATITVEKLPVIFGVRFQIKQLITNLISNALKYTAEGVSPIITVSGVMLKGSEVPLKDVDAESSYAKISVRDNGIGFEEKYRAKIFELFQRLHSRHVYSGTGIGLALCKKIVENAHGFITADSEPGKGSVFTFYLPVRSEKSIP
jgi:PAS domain S-box-containing protein